MDCKRIDFLENTLKQVIDWLKFAEAKNGALIAVGCATIFGVFRMYTSLNEVNEFITYYVVILLALTAASVVLSLMSFIPRIDPPFWISMPEKLDTDNPLFFGHACKYSKGTYLDLFNKYIESSASNSLKIESALSDQIVNNSRIAFIKYNIFGSAIFLFLAGILTPAGALVLYLIKK